MPARSGDGVDEDARSQGRSSGQALLSHGSRSCKRPNSALAAQGTQRAEWACAFASSASSTWFTDAAKEARP